jgi:pyridoxamine 5'-phosphate oxidase
MLELSPITLFGLWKVVDEPLDSQLTQALRTLRREHEDIGIDVVDLDDDPLVEFDRWMQLAIDADLPLPNAMMIATADSEGRPSARVTLLKGVDANGFVFFSNYESRKGREVIENPHAAIVFYWGPLGRQVRVEGTVERVPEDESLDYFQTRSRGSRIGAWASPQSQVIADRAALEALVAEVEQRFPGEDVPLPPHWGGFRLRPERIEFWNGRPSRLHDRILYTPAGEGTWKKARLAP